MVSEETLIPNGKIQSETATVLSRKEEERLLRQRWAESKILEEAVARKLEKYLQDSLNQLLEQRNEELESEVSKRVKEGVTVIEARRAEEEKKRHQEISEAIKRKEEDDRKRRELSERLEKEREQGLVEARKREEADRLQKYQKELKMLEEKQKKDADEQRRIKREQEVILNRKHVRPKLSFSFKK